jgi:FtsH-binding integral membrane protein
MSFFTGNERKAIFQTAKLFVYSGLGVFIFSWVILNVSMDTIALAFFGLALAVMFNTIYKDKLDKLDKEIKKEE